MGVQDGVGKGETCAGNRRNDGSGIFFLAVTWPDSGGGRFALFTPQFRETEDGRDEREDFLTADGSFRTLEDGTVRLTVGATFSAGVGRVNTDADEEESFAALLAGIDVGG